MELSPGGIIAWISVGLIAGWAASSVSRGHGYGIIGDVIVGLIGALILLAVLRMFGRSRAGA